MISLGIDIGSYSVKIAEAELTSKGYVLRRFENIPLSIDPNKDHEIEVLDILRNLAQEYDQNTTRFILAVDQQNVSFRRRLFPFKERHKILKSLPFELEDDIPLSQAFATFDAKITRYIGNSSDVIAVACPNEVIEQKIQLSDDCRFNLEVLSIEGLALGNLFEAWNEPPPSLNAPDSAQDDDEDSEDGVTGSQVSDDIPSPAEILLSVGHQSTSMLVIKDRSILEVRTFNWGGHSVAQRLARKYSMQSTEATRELENKSFLLLNSEDVTNDQITFSDTIKADIDEFSHELNLTLLEIRSIYNLNYTKGLITGGMSQLKNIGPYLTQKTEIPFQRYDVLSNNPSNEAQTRASDGYIAGLALGLAIEGLKKPKNPPINLLKGEFAKQSQSAKVFVEKWGHTLKVLAAAFVLFLIFGITKESLTIDMVDKADTVLRSQAVKIIPEIKKENKASRRKIKQYIKKQNRLQKNVEIFKDLQNQNSALDILKSISRVSPGKSLLNLNVKQLSIANKDVVFAGEIKRKADIPKLSKAIKSIAIGGKVQETRGSVRAQSGWSPFQFEFKVNRSTGGNP